MRPKRAKRVRTGVPAPPVRPSAPSTRPKERALPSCETAARDEAGGHCAAPPGLVLVEANNERRPRVLRGGTVHSGGLSLGYGRKPQHFLQGAATFPAGGSSVLSDGPSKRRASPRPVACCAHSQGRAARQGAKRTPTMRAGSVRPRRRNRPGGPNRSPCLLGLGAGASAQVCDQLVSKGVGEGRAFSP